MNDATKGFLKYSFVAAIMLKVIRSEHVVYSRGMKFDFN